MVQGAAVGGIYNGAEGAHRNPLNILNPLNPLNLHTEGVSKGTSRLFLHDCMLPANTVISSGGTCRYGRQMENAPMIL